MNIEQIAGQQAHLRSEMRHLDKHIEELKQAQAKPGWPPDPVSGLVPRFKPSTVLPKGAVHYHQEMCHDYYWFPDGTVWTAWVVEPKLRRVNDVPFSLDDKAFAAARALSLPLAGEPGGLAEGEEAWTDERIEQAGGYEAGQSAMFVAHAQFLPNNTGLNNLRRWGNARLGGWVCRKVAKPAPGPAPAEVKERLIAAGFDVRDLAPHNNYSKAVPAAVPCADGHIRVSIDCDDVARAEAALLASQGRSNDAINLEIKTNLVRQLSARNAELAKAKAERDTAKRRVDEDEAEIERIRRGEAALTKSRDMWKRAATENAAEIERLRERSAAQGREFEQADAIVARLRGEAKEAGMLLRLAKAPFLDDAWEARREAWLERNRAAQ